MAQPITAYTDTDAIRSALGVTDNEVTDAMLVDQRLALELTVDLDGWADGHAAAFAAGSLQGADAAAQLKANYISLYAQWYCAERVITNMKLAIPQMISDGKTEMRRFQMMDMDAVERAASARAAHYKSLLSLALGGTAETVMSFASRSTPTYDPVTG
jgi:hypothetical protein